MDLSSKFSSIQHWKLSDKHLRTPLRENWSLQVEKELRKPSHFPQSGLFELLIPWHSKYPSTHSSLNLLEDLIKIHPLSDGYPSRLLSNLSSLCISIENLLLIQCFRELLGVEVIHTLIKFCNKKRYHWLFHKSTYLHRKTNGMYVFLNWARNSGS